MSGTKTMRNPVNDRRLDDPSSMVDVVFDGSITLWRTGTNLDVLIVHHELEKIMEVVAYDPSINVEAPRLYVYSQLLRNYIKEEDFELKLLEKKEFFIRRHKDYVLPQLEKDVFHSYASNFILSRIALDSASRSDDFFAIFLQPKFGDKVIQADAVQSNFIPGCVLLDGSRVDVVTSRPRRLEPIATEHHTRLRASLFLKCLAQFEQHSKDLQASSEQATALLMGAQTAVSAFVMPRSLLLLDRDMSAARVRWIRAINRVLNQNCCLKVRALLSKQSHLTTGGNGPASPRVRSNPHTSAQLLTPLSPAELRSLTHGPSSSTLLSSTSSPRRLGGNNTPRGGPSASSGPRPARLGPHHGKDHFSTYGDAASSTAAGGGRLASQSRLVSKALQQQLSSSRRGLASAAVPCAPVKSELDGEVAALLRNVTPLLTAEEKPHYAQQTVSRVLMISKEALADWLKPAPIDTATAAVLPPVTTATATAASAAGNKVVSPSSVIAVMEEEQVLPMVSCGGAD